MKRTDFVVLGAGRPTGYAGPHGLEEGSAGPAYSLQWLRSAVRDHVATSHFVAGYAVEETAAHLEGFSIEYNARWESTGSIASLLCAPVPSEKAALVSYADIVFRENIVAELIGSDADIAIAIDSNWRDRYAARTKHDLDVAEKVQLGEAGLVAIGRDVSTDSAQAEFVGLARLSPEAMATVREAGRLPKNLLDKGSLAGLIGALAREPGISVSYHDVMGDWAELNAPQDLARFVLGTKAETLDRLRPLVRRTRIEDQVRFTVADWTHAPQDVITSIRIAFGGRSVIVRSSARSEDSWATANAGAYASVPNVAVDGDESLSQAIETVVESYGVKRRPEDQVLVQPMLTDVVANGVVFTRTLSHGAPYFVVNYNETPGSTDAVTAGNGDLQILYMHHEAAAPPAGAPQWIAALIDGSRELIELVGYDTLDLEFVVGASGIVHLLQLRPISVDHSHWTVDDRLVSAELRQSVARYERLQTLPGFIGDGQPIFGVMPDWNPAEIVGVRPSLLSVSLYRYLICDEIWAKQRAEHGYHDVRPQPLLVSFAGHPYVNVRASFRSFVPASVPEELADRLVDHYVGRLVAEPALHDKVEFKIAFTCLSFDFHDRADAELRLAGLGDAEIETLRKGLAAVTVNGLRRYGRDLEMVEELAARHKAIMAKRMHPLERACALLEDCRRFGTLPFAHLARGGFIAVTLMRSAVAKGYIDQEFLEKYLGSISTVAKEFVHDSAKAATGDMPWSEFLELYGHLRPGTYDIASPAYRDNDAKLLRDAAGGLKEVAGPAEEPLDVAWPEGSWTRMQAALSSLGVEVEFEEFDRFVRAAIEGREYAKFVFSRNLSDALDCLAAYGEEIGIDR